MPARPPLYFIKVILGRAKNSFASLQEWYGRKTRVTRVVVIPGIIAGLVFLARVVPGNSSLAWPIIALVIVLTVLSNAIAYSEQKSNDALATMANTYKRIAEQLGQLAADRSTSIARGLSDADKPPLERLSAVRNSWNYRGAQGAINSRLYESIKTLVHRRHQNRDINIVLALMKPGPAGKFEIIGDVLKSKGSGNIRRRVQLLRADDKATFAGALWNDTPKCIKSTRSTKESEARGEFTFVDPQERQYLRSIVAYRVDNSQTGDPMCMWCVDADCEGTFPDDADEKDALYFNQLSHLFDSFGKQIEFESAVMNVVGCLDELNATKKGEGHGV
jgi:hypothetical protein